MPISSLLFHKKIGLFSVHQSDKEPFQRRFHSSLLYCTADCCLCNAIIVSISEPNVIRVEACSLVGGGRFWLTLSDFYSDCMQQLFYCSIFLLFFIFTSPHQRAASVIKLMHNYCFWYCRCKYAYLFRLRVYGTVVS